MGGKWEVSEWTWAPDYLGERHYRYDSIYMGESLWRALWTMAKAKRRGAGCVKLEWR